MCVGSSRKGIIFYLVLEQLVESEDGQKPETILTDGDKVMANAIEGVFPLACHKLCLWHLMRNAKGHSGDKFGSGLIKCVNKYRTPNDFEKDWEDLVIYYGIKNKKWAIELYNDKEKWTEAIWVGIFLQVRKLSFYICLKINIVVDILYVSFLYLGIRSTQICGEA